MHILSTKQQLQTARDVVKQPFASPKYQRTRMQPVYEPAPSEFKFAALAFTISGL